MLDRRSFILASAGAFAATRAPAQSAAPADASFADLHAKARAEGELTWYIAHWNTGLAERVGAAFTQSYPGVRVNVVRATSQVIYQRLTQDLRAKVANCDVFSSADNGQYVALRKDNRLIPYAAKNLGACAPVARDYDPEHFITITDSNPTVLAYNTTLVPAAEAPRKWTDLLDPKWSGQVALPHPGFSGAMGAWTMTMNDLYGWQFFEKLHANKPFVARSLADPPVTIASGERKLGLSTGGTAANMAARGQPLKIVYPEDGSILNVGPSAIVAGTQRPNAAKLFIEFLLSKEAGQLVTSDFTIPVRMDVTPQPGIARLGELNGIKIDPLALEKKLPDLIEKWRDTFGV